jgi:cytochrome c556
MRLDRHLSLERLITAAALILMLAGCAGRSGPPMREHGWAPANGRQVTDTRRQVSLMPAERNAVLAEMRTMLGSVSGVLHGLTANDHEAIEKAARASGMAMAVDPTLEQKLPQQFLEMGMATHKKFDQLADLARTRAPADQVVRSLADVTTSCVACHAMYRF